MSSVGPTPELLALAEWAAWRWVGPRVVLLRAASPPNNVAPASEDSLEGLRHHPRAEEEASDPDDRAASEVVADEVAADALADTPSVVQWPPAGDRRRLVGSLLASKGSTIVCTPEPGRSGALVASLRRSGRDVVVFDPSDSDAERTRCWRRARGGDVVVVGGRSASLAPVPDLRSVVVLDEGDEAYESERAPTWNARELLLERARRVGASAVLVAPTPSLDALALCGDRLIAPPEQFQRRGWPPLQTVDRREQPPGEGLFSAALADALHGTVNEGGHAWCVLNRKGRARMLACRRCGEVARCEDCGAAVREVAGDADTDTSGDPALVCPRCGRVRPRVCALCFSTDLRRIRSGVTRVREEVEALLPRTRVGLVDAGNIESADALVLVGTAALFHADLTPPALVAFLDFDQELLAGRYRAAEQAMALLVRAARAVGLRGRGRILVQTRTPDHEVLRAAETARPEIARQAEADHRRTLGFPPFGDLAEIRGSLPAVEAAIDALGVDETVRVDGPLVVDVSKSAALVRAPDTATLVDALHIAREAALSTGGIRIDVDPRRV